MKIRLFLITSLLAIACLCFAACGTETPPPATGGNETGIPTKADWDAAFAEANFDNVKLNISMTEISESAEDGETAGQTSTMKIQKKGDERLIEQQGNKSGEEANTEYFRLLPEKGYSYTWNEEKNAWLRSREDDAQSNYTYSIEYIMLFSPFYSDLTWNEEAKQFSSAGPIQVTGDIDGIPIQMNWTDVTVKLDGGHAVLLSGTMRMEIENIPDAGITQMFRIELSDYGTTVVTLPKAQDPELTETIFSSGLSNLYNYTLHSDILYSDGTHYESKLMREAYNRYYLHENIGQEDEDSFEGYLLAGNGGDSWKSYSNNAWNDITEKSIGEFSPEFFPYYDALFTMNFNDCTFVEGQDRTLQLTEGALAGLNGSEGTMTIDSVTITFDCDVVETIVAQVTIGDRTLTLTYTFSQIDVTSFDFPEMPEANP